jgi:tetratricopeptide (TPR) repeat protein
MEQVARQYVIDAEKLLKTTSYLEYFSYFKNLKLKEVAKIYQKTANLLESLGNFEQAAQNYVLSATYYIELDNTMLSVLNHCNAGNCFKKARNYKKSTISYLMVLEQCFEHDLIIKCSSCIAENYFDMGNVAESVQWFEKCIQSNVKIGRDDLNFDFYDKLGIIYCTYLKRYAIGITLYDKLVELLQKRNDASLHIYCFISVLLRILANDDDDNMGFAKKYMDSLDKPFLQSGYADFLRNIFFLLGKDEKMLKTCRTYFEKEVAGLKNINVQTLINSVMGLKKMC